VVAACRLLDLPRRSFYRLQAAPPPPRPARERAPHPRALSLHEQAHVRATLNSERFGDRSPRTVYATLLDEGVYLCHWRTMYRLLALDAATRERRAIRRHPLYSRPELLATAPRQVWSWDITKLRGPYAGVWYSLYVVLDIFSRAIVGWLLADREDALLAEQLLADACAREGIGCHELVIHADRGAPMTSKTVSELLVDLGVGRSHSRPRVSNDNPYSEAQFKTMKYGASYPERFASIEEARAWVRVFVSWYNSEHRHSGIGLLTPLAVHQGHAPALLAGRQEVLDLSYASHPERFVRGRPSPAAVPSSVWINAPHPANDASVVATTPAPAPLAVPGSRGEAAQRPLDAGPPSGNPQPLLVAQAGPLFVP
jgi:putative transposase